jgi:DNA-binding NarL/FixJ family response regulator
VNEQRYIAVKQPRVVADIEGVAHGGRGNGVAAWSDDERMSAGVGQLDAIRVLVVDDHDLFRTGLASLLAGQPGIDVVAQASGGQAGVRLANELQPDVVLMDLRMPDLDGPAATRAILDKRPSTRVLALTVVDDESGVADALEAGSCGYLAKDTPIEGVVAAVRAAAQGAAWLSPRAAEVVLGHLRRNGGNGNHDGGPTHELSARELDVLRLIARGMENSEIADALSISRRTAKNHVSNILAKLGLPSRVQAAIYAVRRGLT